MWPRRTCIGLGMLLAGLLLPSGPAQARRPIVAVFTIADKGAGLDPQTLERLSDYLASALAATGAYQVIPRSQLKERLVQQKKESFKQCYDQSCQIEIGRELAAQKSVATEIIKIGSQCLVTAVMYDLRTATSQGGARAEGLCAEDQILTSIQTLIGRMVPQAPTPASPPQAVTPPPPLPPPSTPPPAQAAPTPAPQQPKPAPAPRPTRRPAARPAPSPGTTGARPKLMRSEFGVKALIVPGGSSNLSMDESSSMTGPITGSGPLSADLDTAYGVGFHYDRGLARYLFMGISFDLISPLKAQDAQNESKLLNLNLRFKGVLPLLKVLDLYLLAAGGVSLELAPEDIDGARGYAFTFAAGASFFVLRNIGLFCEVGYIGSFLQGTSVNDIDFELRLDLPQVNFGAALRF